MTLKEFTELLDSHGSDLGKWPENRRVAAVALLDRSEEAKRAFADACVFDASLRHGDGDMSPERRRSLIDGIMDAVRSKDGDAGTKLAETPSAKKLPNRSERPPETPRSDVASSATVGDIATAPRRPH